MKKNYRLILLLLVVIVSTWIFFTSPPSANAGPPPPCYNYLCAWMDMIDGVIVNTGQGDPIGITAPNAYTITLTDGTCQSPGSFICTGYLVNPPFPGNDYIGPCIGGTAGALAVISTPTPPSPIITVEFYGGGPGSTAKWVCALQ